MNDFIKLFDEINISERELNNYSPLVLAYIGDAVYEVFVRAHLVIDSTASSHVLHKRSTEYVKAKAQADIVHAIMDKLTEEESNVVRRGRNAKSGTVPKNADLRDYKYATGFEALIGYLFLKKDYTRLNEIIKMSLQGIQ